MCLVNESQSRPFIYSFAVKEMARLFILFWSDKHSLTLDRVKLSIKTLFHQDIICSAPNLRQKFLSLYGMIYVA